MSDQIEKQIELAAPVSRVWQALTDSQKFGQWFQVAFDGPFVAGQPVAGRLTFPGHEGKPLSITVQKIAPETLFSYTWHPNANDPKVDYSHETPTLVEFRLAPAGKGTLLTLTESGFDKVPADRRAQAFRSNTGGWAFQLDSIKSYVEKTATE